VRQHNSDSAAVLKASFATFTDFQQFLHESDTWPEPSRSNVRGMIIRRGTEIERQQPVIFPKGYMYLSIDAGTILHVQTLDFILTREGSRVA
jgi:hypothetical protein